MIGTCYAKGVMSFVAATRTKDVAFQLKSYCRNALGTLLLSYRVGTWTRLYFFGFRRDYGFNILRINF